MQLHITKSITNKKDFKLIEDTYKYDFVFK